MTGMTEYQKIDAIARSFGFAHYSDYLRSDHWKNLKRQVTSKLCCVCGSRTNLRTHHIRYRNLLDVEPADLVKMCEPCHDDFHLACRYYKLPYIDADPERIAVLTNTFRSSPYYIKRAEKLKRKRSGLKPVNHTKQSTKQSKAKMKRAFKHFLKGKMRVDRAESFCKWLIETVKNYREPVTNTVPVPYEINESNPF